MGLSRNKVAVPEGAAGTPPFWSDVVNDVILHDSCKMKHRQNTDFKGSVFCTTGTCLFIIYRSTIYRSIDRDKQEKKEAESRRKVDKVELVL